MGNLIFLREKDLERIMEVERRAFMRSIRADAEKILKRIRKGHTYLGIEQNGELVGSMGLRLARFKPDLENFCRRFPTFNEYAEAENERKANAVFVYSLGIAPENRNFVNARRLIEGAIQIAGDRGLNFTVGDARIPSYNGSNNLPYEFFEQNPELRKAIDECLTRGEAPPRELLEQDPVSGAYLKMFPNGKVLGVTGKDFWKGDEPCGGHMAIMYWEER